MPFDVFKINQIKAENESLKQENNALRNEIARLQNILNGESSKTLKAEISALEEQLKQLRAEKEKIDSDLQNEQIKIESFKVALKAAQKAMKAENNNSPDAPELVINTFTLFTHISELHFNCLDVPKLRKLFSSNKSNIQKLVQKYEVRYTTKTNKAIYQLMVMALEAELQIILLNLRFGTVEAAKEKVKEISKRYYEIAANGNQSIAGTVKKFITELEVYYMEAVDIEYEYYTQKERIKEEQRAIKEQMRQEAEERKQLEQQQKKLEKEEAKYKNEMDNVRLAIAAADAAEMEKLKARLLELENMLNAVEDKKEQVINLQNGQAGNVYVISNIGSFGENVFKVGMTRRLEPQERIDELGNASVPFPFDVHSFIFSDNAVELENKLHKILDARRVNKVNKRKEFFRVTLNELEQLVHKIEPTAEFRMTALAEQYTISQREPDGAIDFSVSPQNIPVENSRKVSVPSAPTKEEPKKLSDTYKQALVNFRTQEEAAPNCLKIHVYDDNRKLGIVKLYHDNTAEFKSPGQNSIKISSVDDLKACLK